MSVSFSIKMTSTYLDIVILKHCDGIQVDFEILLVGIDELCELCIIDELSDHLNSLGFKARLVDCEILRLHGSTTAIVSRSSNIGE